MHNKYIYIFFGKIKKPEYIRIKYIHRKRKENIKGYRQSTRNEYTS